MKNIVVLLAILVMGCSSSSSDDAQKKLTLGELQTTIEKNEATLGAAVNTDSLLFVANQSVDYVDVLLVDYPQSEGLDKYLYYGAKAARVGNQFQKSVDYYDIIIQKFKHYPQLDEVMFLKAFILDEDMQQKDAAKEAYQALIHRFPKSKYAADAQLLMTQLYMSDDDLLRMIKEKNPEMRDDSNN